MSPEMLIAGSVGVHPTTPSEAGATAMRLPESYYREMAADYGRRRDVMLGMLREAGFEVFSPRGAYYIMTDFSAFGYDDDVKFTEYMIQEIGVAVVPGSSFYRDPAQTVTLIRSSHERWVPICTVAVAS